MKSKLILAALSLCFFAVVSSSQEQEKKDSGLVAHEWGTFTSIAGAHGEAVVWRPQLENDDLPNFVEHMRNNRLKGGLSGTVRMETPVLYFHATHPTTISVHVDFPDGLLTEWYPHAANNAPAKELESPIPQMQGNTTGLTWSSISIDPGSAPRFPVEHTPSRYYASREASASSLTATSANGTPQHEKFLFYRGVASFHVPISALPMNGGHILISNLSRDAVPEVILFERRGSRLGYRYVGTVLNSSITETPELNSDLYSVTRDLERTLVEQGLYQDEAHAMVETWKDSWFEEGTRVLYIVPQNFVDAVLPLNINPAPAKTVRVFVGRMEVVTPATEKAIETAYAKGDHTSLAKYGRFLIPILETMISRSTDEKRRGELNAELNSAYSDIAAQLSAGR
jgi:hypothetical protein